MRHVENKTYDEVRIGDAAERVREATDALTGEVWAAAAFAALFAEALPGPGAVLLFLALNPGGAESAQPQSRLTARVEALEKLDSGRVRFSCSCTDDDGRSVSVGEAIVAAPREHRRRTLTASPVEPFGRGGRFAELIERTKPLPPLETAVVHPCDPLSLGGAIAAARDGIIRPLLVGPDAKIRAAAEAGGLDLTGFEIVDAPHSHAAADRAVALVREGRAEGLMKGSLHTDEFMDAIVPSEAGLRTGRRMSHVYALDAPHYSKLLFLTDAAINIAPDLTAHRDIVQNAIDLARALDIDPPRVAILSAVETVTPKIPFTLTAAALCKMADRGQITGGRLDGPLAFDNAISLEAARTKAIASDVAGQADILIAPDLEAGNMLAKQLIHLADAEAAGVVLGARCPIMLTSRADDIDARKASAALALLFARKRLRLPLPA